MDKIPESLTEICTRKTDVVNIVQRLFKYSGQRKLNKSLKIRILICSALEKCMYPPHRE